MQLIDNAGRVAKKGASVHLWTLALILEVVGMVWPVVQTDVQELVNPQVFHIIAVVASAAGIVARFIKQQSVSGEDDGVSNG